MKENNLNYRAGINFTTLSLKAAMFLIDDWNQPLSERWKNISLAAKAQVDEYYKSEWSKSDLGIEEAVRVSGLGFCVSVFLLTIGNVLAMFFLGDAFSTTVRDAWLSLFILIVMNLSSWGFYLLIKAMLGKAFISNLKDENSHPAPAIALPTGIGFLVSTMVGIGIAILFSLAA